MGKSAEAPEGDLWSAKQVASYFGIEVRTLRTWRETDATFPKPLDLPGRTLRWYGQDIVDWALSLRGLVG